MNTKQELTIVRLGRELLHASPTNPRKRFGQLDELALSIGAHGIKQPLLVRPSRAEAGMYEIIAGERRWRAHELAMPAMAAGSVERGLPCLVEDMSDEAALEVQLVENLQRVDLTPLEEADGYAQMLSLRDPATGEVSYTVEKIAEKLGRTVATVYRALKWTRLPELARSAMEAGLCNRTLATMIGRVPDALMRRRATLELLFFAGDLFFAEEDIEAAEQDARQVLSREPETMAPLTQPAAREHVREHYMASLTGVRFDLADAETVEVELDEAGLRCGGGSCMDCPMRTGSSAEYHEEVRDAGGRGLDPMVCTAPSCRAKKIERQAQREVAVAESQGMEIIGGKEGAAFFYEGRDGEHHYRDTGKYVLLAAKPGYDLLGHVNEGKVKTWGKLLEKLNVPTVMLVDPSGAPHAAADRGQAVLAVNLAALKAGKESPFERANKTEDRPPKIERSMTRDASESDLLREVEQHRAAEKSKLEAERKKEGEKKKLEGQTALEALRLVVDAVAQRGGLALDDWPWLIELALPEAGSDGVMCMAAMLDVKPEKKGAARLELADYTRSIMEHLAACERPKGAMEGLLVALLVAQQTKWSGMGSARLKAVMKRFEVSEVEAKQLAKDVLGLRKKGKAEMRTESRSEAVSRNDAGHEAAERDEWEQGKEVEHSTPNMELPTSNIEPPTSNPEELTCDGAGCGKSVMVPRQYVQAVVDMAEGEFLCTDCGGEWVPVDLPEPVKKVSKKKARKKAVK